MDRSATTILHDALDRSGIAGDGRVRITRAEQLMAGTLGRAGPRKDGSSPVEHSLRVATNVLDVLGVLDADLVIAALLHDVVEDASRLLAPDAADEREAQATALRRIETEFGARVARTVAMVTLPDIDAIARARIAAGDARTHESVRNEIYADAIARTVRGSTDALTVKLADFLDNGVRVDPIARPGLAAKYRPLFTILPEALMALPESAALAARRDAVLARIGAARVRVYGR